VRSYTFSARRGAFSLIELVIVVVIMGIIAAIAVPRLSSAADNAAANAVIHDQAALQRSIDLYTQEHGGVQPDVGAGTLKVFTLRLLGKSFEDGKLDADGYLGPYLHGIPTNKINGLATIRMDGVAAGANTAGWRYTSATALIEPDHSGSGRAELKGGRIQGDVSADEVLEVIRKP